MRWASAIDTDALLSAAVTHAAAKIFKGLGNQEPDLLTVFVSAHHAARFEELTHLLMREFDGSYLFGCCAGGVIGGGKEIEDRPCLTLTGALMPGVRMKGVHLDAAQVPPVYAEPRVWEDAMHLTANQQPSFLILADPFSFETETFVKGLDRVFPISPKIGGLASGARQVGGSALYLGKEMYRSGAIALSLTGNVQIDTIVAQGCRPVGDPMFVTMAHENLIRELDGRAPRDVLAALFEQLPGTDRELFSQSLFLGLAMRPDANQYVPGDFLIRNILGMDPQSGALWVNAHVPTNSVVQFHLRDASTSAYDLERALTHYRTATLSAPPSGALLFSCAGRGYDLYGQPDHDSNAFRRLVADIPIGGFFGNGEIGPVQNSTYLHGYTSAFAVFSERR
ncbi:small ligand-binding sensory domain FIST [Povalibacter uvarum]|uniref:Small ligand-binding sensory domain FIST n=1 Tax=Povalibacter uvarum TaxID=732238 RepID=A0A841HS21_9GAMM|nr:FIST N-terminal domain-containing protein [Povalibacter uvarum]MBB6094822.1 small ligand-binding sensory domain FIST [Povalibacter uvarum]